MIDIDEIEQNAFKRFVCKTALETPAGQEALLEACAIPISVILIHKCKNNPDILNDNRIHKIVLWGMLKQEVPCTWDKPFPLEKELRQFIKNSNPDELINELTSREEEIEWVWEQISKM